MHKSRRMWAIGTMVALAVIAAACSSDNTKTATSSSSAPSSSSVVGLTIDYSTLTGSISSTGSSFQDTFDQAVITKFKAKAAGLTVTYTKSASGKGIGDLG